MELQFTLSLIVLLPGAVFAVLGLGWLLSWQPPERLVARLTGTCYALMTIGVAWIAARMLDTGITELRVPLGSWFTVHEYSFPLTLLVDRLSLPLLALSVVLVGIVGAFSVRYLHRDPGYLRFFLLLHLFGFGVLLLFTAGSFDLLIGGWELVGLTSVLLIGYFQHRNDPVRNALRVFLTYRVCDIGLLTGVALLHHYAGTAACDQLFTLAWPDGASVLTGNGAMMVGLLFLFAAMGKAAQVPFSGWLPRAMEGPTPSSAIFYGALSIHAGAYLLLRAQPLLAASRLVTTAIIVVGVATAIHGTLVGRACADAKTAIAYAALTQVGIIFVELGLGWPRLALLHICGHAVIRTLQFLRAPSMLHDHHRLHAAAGGRLGETGAHYEQLLPHGVRQRLYRLALERGHHDTLLERFVINPVVKFAQLCHRFETRWSTYALGPQRKGERRLAAKAGLPASVKAPNPPMGHTMEGADA